MSAEQRERFLAGLHVGVVGVTDPDPERAPLIVPIWYTYSLADGVGIVTSPSSRKGRALEAAGRFSLVAQEESPPYKYVSVEGPVVEVVACDLEEHLRPLAVRYLGERAGNAYAEEWARSGDDSMLYRMHPERWYSVDYSKGAPD